MTLDEAMAELARVRLESAAVAAQAWALTQRELELSFVVRQLNAKPQKETTT